MYTSTALAKKYGLETFLDKPAELNDLIFHLLLLQETIQLEQARKENREAADVRHITVKRSAIGKFVAGCHGDLKYRYAAETALKASTDLLALFNRRRFISILLKMGVPEEKIIEFSRSVTIEDDVHCVDHE